MEWVVLCIGAVVAVGWWLGRSSSPPTPPPARTVSAAAAPVAGFTSSPLAAEIARKSADPDDPDGAFMDGYVSGRYTERYLHRRDAEERSSGHDDSAHRQRSDDKGLDDGDDVWADPYDSFDDDFSDDW